MIFAFKPYSIIFLTGTVLTLVLALVVWKRRPAPGAHYFAAFNFATLVWSLFWILEIGAVDIPSKIIWAKLEYFGILATAPLWIRFVLDYSAIDWRKSLKSRILLWTIPTMMLVLVCTNEWHGWFWSSIYFVDKTFGRVTIWEHGTAFWISTAYQYLLVAAGAYILWRYRNRNSKNSRKQVASLTVGTALPILINMIYLLKIPAIDGLDFTPLSIALSGIIYIVTVFRYHLLDISAVARNTLVEKVPDGILVLDAGGKIIDMNPAAEKIAGFYLPSTCGKLLAQVWPYLDQTRTTMDSGQHREIAASETGLSCDLDISLTSIYDRQQILAGQLIVLRDITERKQTQRKMESLYQEECRLRNALQEEIDNRSKYTRALVHELKTPLTAILSSGELLETEIHDEILQDVVKNIRQASLHLERRTNELIDLACGEIGMLKVESEPLDMQKLLDQIVHKMSPLAAEKGLCLKLDLENIPLVNGDGKRTRMVLSNIIHNAIKYSESGDIIIRARDFDNANLLVQVKDNGCGIGREQMEKLFDPYRRKTTEGQKYGGIGVGLAVSRLYIELQKGKIWVESIPHKGTTVNFTLPVWREININLLSGRDNTSTVRLSSHPLQ